MRSERGFQQTRELMRQVINISKYKGTVSFLVGFFLGLLVIQADRLAEGAKEVNPVVKSRLEGKSEAGAVGGSSLGRPAVDQIEASTDTGEQLIGAGLVDFATTEVEAARFIEETRSRLYYLKKLEIAIKIEQIKRKLSLAPAEIDRMEAFADQVCSVPTDGDAVLAEYARFATLDPDAVASDSLNPCIEAQLLASINRPEAGDYAEHARSLAQDSWALRSLAEVQLSLNLSAEQRESVYSVFREVGKEYWPEIAEPAGTQALQQISMRALEAMTPILSSTQLELIRSKWRIVGRVP
jgi:hypothetical protein